MKLPQDFKTLSNINLSSDERALLWMRIETANQNLDIKNSNKPRFIWLRYASASLAAMATGLVLLIGSANALPGQQLYSLKTGVNEPLQRLTTFGSDNKIELEKRLLIKRVEEAKQLKNRGLLDIKVAENIENQIRDQAGKAVAGKEAEKNELDTKPIADNPDTLDDENDQSEEKAAAEISIAEIKGTASGSIKAVKLLAGESVEQALELDDQLSGTTELNNVTDNNQELSSEIIDSDLLQSSEPQKVLDVDEPRSPESKVAKTKIQAQAKIATTKAEESNKKLETSNTKGLDDGIKDNKAVNQTNRNKIIEVNKQIVESAKQVVDQDIEMVGEEELLEAVESASAATVVSEAISSDE
jgi:hypothetical protein